MALQNIEANITLDLYNHDTTPATVKAIQLDSQTRYVAAMLQNVGVQYDVDSGVTIQLIVVRPDNVGVQITGETFEYGEEGAQFLGPYAELTQVALAVSGKMRGQFKITSGTQILRTEIFAINNGVALDASTDEWADEYDGYNLEEMATSIETNTTDIASLEADVSQIKEDFTYIAEEDVITTTETFDQNSEGVTVANGYTQENGSFITNNSYRNILVPITADGTCYPVSSTSFVHLAVYSTNVMSAANLIPGKYYSNALGNVPTANSPVTVHAGEYVAVSTKKAPTHQLKYTYDVVNGYKLNDDLGLTDAMKEEIWSDNPLNENNVKCNYASIFRTMSVIGDSLASGRFNGGGNTGDEDASDGLTDYNMSWIQMMARKAGNTAFNLSRGGMDTKGFFTYKRTDLPGEPYIKDLLNEDDWFSECYFIALGHNDKNHYATTGVTLGTEADIGTEANTYYANYARIISAIQEEHPYSKIFCLTMRNDDDESVNPANLNFHNMNIAIRTMPNHFKNCYVLDMGYYYDAPAPEWSKTGAHGNAMGYLYYANQVESLLNAYIMSHTTDFKYVQLIGTTAESTIPDSQNAGVS